MFVAFIGAFVVTPIVLYCFYKFQITTAALGYVAITKIDEIHFILAYVGISIGVAGIGGIINAIFLRATERYETPIGDNLIFA
jgi:hypothetical protein